MKNKFDFFTNFPNFMPLLKNISKVLRLLFILMVGVNIKAYNQFLKHWAFKTLLHYHKHLNTIALLSATIDTLLKLVLPYYIKHPFLWSIRPLLFEPPPISLIVFPCYFCNCKLIHLKNCFTTLQIMQNCEYLVACVFLASRFIHNISLSLSLSLASF